ncbi:RdgB/HAM1 family non-canonical purine NTP pyrophosphatase [Faecalibacter rhinopitheci]|uniref:dITP/XTP pyrophosphatase n=1 Tax=Faecalibacter rhinopitheci TaxID=2779678 RepID=A0A8J7K3Q2_9FLAO|nr:RdgB/HAM1 family non-canonical purine NTP pyrophosphatase [Faecalibacter rhinopitheci]MBF0596449.1 RdgB/HAM1 family non-canonical purine NTP pyrophosphatase [Faecalibacter rhinopitheci]
MELIFATHNQHKLEEVKQMLPQYIQFKSLTEINFNDEIEETGDTFIENARIKAQTIYKKTGVNVFADDSGLVIEGLEGAPGVYSARYAGTGKSEDNIAKVLEELKDIENRNAYFIAVFCLILDGKEYFFEGRINGTISKSIMGADGFGYDPIFIPENYTQSFAEMSAEEKNSMSHRGRAVEQLNKFLSKTN